MEKEIKSVAIITRTKDRPLFLARAVQSVINQSFKDCVWVIVNDGGTSEPVDRVAEHARHCGIDTVVIHHPVCRGMEAASNSGLSAATSQYVVIHDDDDSWNDEFLSQTVAFLESQPMFAGVVTGFRNVAERIRKNRIVQILTWDAIPVYGALQMADLAIQNPFPPICFLYRRCVVSDLGGYREDLPVLGDWEFNLRILEKWDIAGIPEVLANYHHRLGITSGSVGNSLYAGTNHAMHDARLRNELLRQDLAKGRIGLGHLLSQGRLALVQRDRIDTAWRAPLRGLRRSLALALERIAEKLGR